MKSKLEPKEKITILEEEIKEIKKEEELEEVIDEEDIEEDFNKEEPEEIEDFSKENFVPILEQEENSEVNKRFVLDDLKDFPTPKNPEKKQKIEEFYNSSKAEDFYNNGSAENLYAGINPNQIPLTTDFYEQSSLESFYNQDSSDNPFYVVPTELEEPEKDDRIEAPGSLEKSFKEEKKDDLMFRS